MKFTIAATALTAFLATSAFANGTPGAGFFNEWDIVGDGQVTVEDVASRRSDIFVSFDADDNGILDAGEYAFFDEARVTSHEGKPKPGGGNRKAAVGMTLAFNDVNGDGSVTLEEFVGQSAAWLALLDLNGDGVVMADDFGPNL
ncbi:MAG: calcium-binding protein [Rhodobacteraceae bacterium]|nr:MAG: calcium-binding protein [Paracoccaceae bacterium]